MLMCEYQILLLEDCAPGVVAQCLLIPFSGSDTEEMEWNRSNREFSMHPVPPLRPAPRPARRRVFPAGGGAEGSIS